jgi:GT2 family glycosyltransferase
MIRKDVSIIVINYGRADLVVNFLRSVESSNDLDLIREVIVVDNGYPQEGSFVDIFDAYRFPFMVKCVKNAERSYASGVNRGAALAEGGFLLIANNDVELLPNCSIRPLLKYLWENPQVGIVGPQQIYPNGAWQRSYGCFPSLKEMLNGLVMVDSIRNQFWKLAFRSKWLTRRPKKVEYIDGAFMVVRRSCFEDLGGFDESYTFYGEDVDFCWRAKQKNWEVVFIPNVRVIHIRGASSTINDLANYVGRLLEVKQRFVRERFGLRRARWYVKLMRIVFWERFAVYTLIAKILRSRNWRQRAFQARVRYHVLKKLVHSEKLSL